MKSQGANVAHIKKTLSNLFHWLSFNCWKTAEAVHATSPCRGLWISSAQPEFAFSSFQHKTKRDCVKINKYINKYKCIPRSTWRNNKTDWNSLETLHPFASLCGFRVSTHKSVAQTKAAKFSTESRHCDAQTIATRCWWSTTTVSCDHTAQVDSHDSVDVAGGANGLVGISQNPAAGRRDPGVAQTASHYKETNHYGPMDTLLMKEWRERPEKSGAGLTWVWAADEGAEDEHRAQSHETKLTVWHLSHSLLGAGSVRPCACVCVWLASITALRLSRAPRWFSPALRNQWRWLFNQWQHNQIKCHSWFRHAAHTQEILNEQIIDII